MPSRKEYNVRFTPRGLSDAWDSSETFPGACLSLQNLIFDQSNPELVVCRPGVGSPITQFNSPSFSVPTFVSVQIAIGSVIYGMISVNSYGGTDQPFAYNITTNSFITISGITSSNLPTAQSTSGDWTPPTMAVIGTKIIVTHPGFSGSGSNFFGVINIANPAAPAWSASNTSTNTLPTVPTAVANFNNRAYFACGQLLYYSDPLNPVSMTNAGQALTIGDTTPIVALSGLPVQTTSSGIVASLMVFKAFQIFQVTGDAAITNSLSLNFLSLNIGTNSPRSVVQTPAGTIFASIDGPYFISPLGQVLPLTKDMNKLTQDIQRAYQNIITPTRAAAGFSGSIYRICMTTVINGVQQTNDYWFDITLRRWSGPHSFPYDTISQVGNYFVISSRTILTTLFASPVYPSLTSVYNDNGTALTVTLQTSQLPKTANINEKQVIESTIEIASQSAAQNFSIVAQDEGFNTVGTANLTIYNAAPVWGGGSIWGSGVTWNSTQNIPITHNIPWSAPLVFKKLSLIITASSNFSLAIGTSFFKYQDLGYTITYNQASEVAPDVWDGGALWNDNLHYWQ